MIVAALLLAVQCADGSPPPCGGRARPAAINPSSVAVLYFDNLSRDTSDAFLASGLTEELIVQLSKVPRLSVQSRFASQRVRGSPLTDPTAVGRTLRAAYLVSGSLQQAGARVRLRVSLIRASSGAQVWAESFDRSGSDIIDIQDAIAREVAGAITGRLLPAENANLARRSTRNPAAYDLYLRGVGAFGFSESGLRAAFDLFDRAIALDSGFADAWAMKGLMWVGLADGYMEGRRAYTEARTLALHALRHDSTNAMALGVLANAAIALDHDRRAAIDLSRRAVAANPASPMGHSMLGVSLLLAGRLDSALASAQRGFLLDTLDILPAVLYLWTMHLTGRTDSIPAVLAHARGTIPEELQRYWNGAYRLSRGDFAGAAERLNWQFYGGMLAGAHVAALVGAGRRDAARAVLDSMALQARVTYVNRYALASAWAAFGDADEAVRYLEQAWDERTSWVIALPFDQNFSALRSDPRVVAVARRMGYAP